MTDSQESKAKHIEEIRERFHSTDRAVIALVRENQRAAGSQSWSSLFKNQTCLYKG